MDRHSHSQYLERETNENGADVRTTKKYWPSRSKYWNGGILRRLTKSAGGNEDEERSTFWHRDADDALHDYRKTAQRRLLVNPCKEELMILGSVSIRLECATKGRDV
ncbi:hypothetical protein KIN20_011302 [Parelaphostrongylus tenuis]|uniref:Uncharacterized protein n=1 Tax=Parelaphostrongylus tenuis TaxID=148309 RepID=A0AAD5MRX4_PARTN|nr:hypothetical protein KIN20_011302 [Parelaphostrongylus tenuis]